MSHARRSLREAEREGHGSLVLTRKHSLLQRSGLLRAQRSLASACASVRQERGTGRRRRCAGGHGEAARCVWAGKSEGEMDGAQEQRKAAEEEWIR